MKAAKGAHRLQQHHTEIKGKASVDRDQEPTDLSPCPGLLCAAPHRRTGGSCKLPAHSRDWAPEEGNTRVRGPRNHGKRGKKIQRKRCPFPRGSQSRGHMERWSQEPRSEDPHSERLNVKDRTILYSSGLCTPARLAGKTTDKKVAPASCPGKTPFPGLVIFLPTDRELAHSHWAW